MSSSDHHHRCGSYANCRDNVPAIQSVVGEFEEQPVSLMNPVSTTALESGLAHPLGDCRRHDSYELQISGSICTTGVQLDRTTPHQGGHGIVDREQRLNPSGHGSHSIRPVRFPGGGIQTLAHNRWIVQRASGTCKRMPA